MGGSILNGTPMDIKRTINYEPCKHRSCSPCTDSDKGTKPNQKTHKHYQIGGAFLIPNHYEIFNYINYESITF